MYSQESSDKNILFKPNMALVISTLNGASHANRVHDFQLQVKWRHHGARRPLCVQLLSGVQQLAPWLACIGQCHIPPKSFSLAGSKMVSRGVPQILDTSPQAI
ncbi:uncharacterized protein LOC107863781 isoform X2 [Capsicum annuum]|uniref:uncharacterized protein LOC107863781 isoform X2 n=1 Tax=Capsicum annuum TaxID=4072 RepID=UPI0007BEE63D|nr:uncharacterized protein LOC107863781 isoform X2 [Capsicum annuum]